MSPMISHFEALGTRKISGFKVAVAKRNVLLKFSKQIIDATCPVSVESRARFVVFSRQGTSSLGNSSQNGVHNIRGQPGHDVGFTRSKDYK